MFIKSKVIRKSVPVPYKRPRPKADNVLALEKEFLSRYQTRKALYNDDDPTALENDLQLHIFQPLASATTPENRQHLLSLLARFSRQAAKVLPQECFIYNTWGDEAPGLTYCVLSAAGSRNFDKIITLPLSTAIKECGDCLRIKDVYDLLRLFYPHIETFRRMVPQAKTMVQPLLARVKRDIQNLTERERDEIWATYALAGSPDDLFNAE